MKLRHPYKYYLFLFKDSKYYLPTVYSTIIVACILLIMFVIYPEIQNFLNIDAQVTQLKTQISTLQNNINNISGLNDSDLQTNFNLVNNAVPVDKDFSGAIQDISSVAIQSNVILNDFTVKVGDYASKSNTPGSSSTQDFTLDIDIDGSPSGIVNFLTKIKNSLPLMSVESISISQAQATIALQVYYVPYQQHTVDLTTYNLSLNPTDQSTLNQLASWNTSNLSPLVNTTTTGNLPTFPSN